MAYRVTSTKIDGALILEPQVFGDARGFFLESFNQADFEEAVGSAVHFVQDNHSRSSKGVLRGLHYQQPQPQGKLVRVVSGCVFDVAVDIRPNSNSFGNWVGVELNDSDHKMFWLPPGLAHGFIVLSDSADFVYKTTDYYAPNYEGCIRWDDPDLAISWPDPGVDIRISEKDAHGQPFTSLRA